MRSIQEGEDLSSVTHFISGGDFLTLAHAKRANKFFKEHGAINIEIGNGSGNAETVSIGSTPVGVPLRQETAGKILVGTNTMVVNPDTMEELKYGEEGLICVSGKHVFKGYYKNEELTSGVKFKRNGREYYKTGTLGIIDEEGYLTITGRQSRFYIMSSLNKVYCDHVQSVISTFDEVKECAVVKVPDEDKLYVNKGLGKVILLYHTEMLDEDGLPMINGKEAIAIADYIAYTVKYKEAIRTNNKNVLKLEQDLK